MAIRIERGNVGETLEQIEAVWQKYGLGAPFEYTFVDDNYLTSYRNEERIGEVFLIFTVLAIVIASLGLFGLSAYTTEQRSKEIGIRKALGATHWEIFVLIGKDFTRLVLVAFLVAAPLTWWAMDQWLQQYPYRIEIPTQTILLSGVLSLVITLVTISAQTIKAANTNPVNSLRNE
jgi:putative ABC transport system permease protein